MQEIEVRLNSHYFILKIHKKRELQNFAANNSAGVNYKDFMNIFRKCKSEPYNSLTIGSNLPANNSLIFRKKSFKSFIKMTLTDEIKILDDKIKANWSQYDLDREVAKIPPLSSKELDKYEYLTSENIGYKQEVVGEAKFECSPLVIKD